MCIYIYFFSSETQTLLEIMKVTKNIAIVIIDFTYNNNYRYCDARAIFIAMSIQSYVIPVRDLLKYISVHIVSISSFCAVYWYTIVRYRNKDHNAQ